MSGKKRTERGFRDFDEWRGSRGEITVRESSLAYEGAHVRIYQDELGIGESNNCIHLSVADAKRIIAALSAFVEEAEAGELCEPAERP